MMQFFFALQKNVVTICGLSSSVTIQLDFSLALSVDIKIWITYAIDENSWNKTILDGYQQAICDT